MRQAIYQAIDIEAIRQEVMRGFASPAGMMVTPGVNRIPELDQRLPYDQKNAQA
ncbi:MAG: ABC transporter substrate-binding protein, partial [Actinomycetota bacterium]|nr:ABC transporter substrate-binding protein [Actinomycetota bacterium]